MLPCHSKTPLTASTEEEICSVYAAGTADVDDAVRAARRAFRSPAWRGLSGAERGALLRRLADLVGAHAAQLATVEALDCGKPYAAALSESVPEVQRVLRYYAGLADRVGGHVVVDDVDVVSGPRKMAYTLRQPLGVCAQIIPWNYPLDMAAWKLAPALCCGNAVVLKPAEATPLSALCLAQLVRAAGFPPGVVNVVTGAGDVAGDALARHAGVDKVAFTGSTATGRTVMRAAAGTLKNITLETGGKSPLLVYADADLPRAAAWAHAGALANQGQVCSATARILVHEAVYDRFVALFCDAVRRLSVVGDPFAPATFQGPQTTRAQYECVLAYIQTGREEGATLALGGHAVSGTQKGLFIEPTVFTDVTPDMTIYRQEIFGPCVTVSTFRTEAEALDMANDSIYGLAAAVFTQDVARAHRVAHALEAGMVWINSSNDADVRVPFGGVKQSGIGRELGEAALAAYTNIKSVHVNLDP